MYQDLHKVKAVLVDGQLNLKFVRNSSSTSDSTAQLERIYLSNLVITRKEL